MAPLWQAWLIHRTAGVHARASRVSRATILSHAGRLPMHRSTAIALSGTGCKPCDRPAARITIGRIGIAVHRIICGFDIAGFTSALRSITEVQRTSRHFAFVPPPSSHLSMSTYLWRVRHSRRGGVGGACRRGDVKPLDENSVANPQWNRQNNRQFQDLILI